MPRRGNKKDANHGEVVDAFQRLGWSVLDMSDFGRGMPDLIVGDSSHGTHMVEIKNAATYYGRKGLSKRQVTFRDSWQGVVHVVRSIDDVIALTRTLAGANKADGGPIPRVVISSPDEARNL